MSDSSVQLGNGLRGEWERGDDWKDYGNGNWRRLDAGIQQLRVEDKDLATPPGSPANGACYIVAASPTGAWAGHAKDIAVWFAVTREVPTGEWKFFTPPDGTLAWVRDEATPYVYTGAAWAKLVVSAGGGIGGGSAGLGMIFVPMNPVYLSGWGYRSGGAGGSTYPVHGGYNGSGSDFGGVASFLTPADFGSFASGKLWYIQNGASGNPWVFKLGMYKHANGADASGALTYGSQKTITPPAVTDQTHVVSLSGGEIPAVTPAPGDIVTVQMHRLSGDAADTNTNEMAMQGLVLNYNRA